MNDSIDERIVQVENGLFPTSAPAYVPRRSLHERMAEDRVPGVSLAVINGGEIEWAKAYGVRGNGQPHPVNTETLFQAASISKPVAALAILRLVEVGKFDLDTDVNDYLTSWKVPPVEGWQPKLTLRQLLSHSAGVTVHGFLGYSHTDTVPTPVEILQGAPPANSDPIRVDTPPGAQFRYSGGGISIAQQVAADVLQTRFSEIAYEWALKPLGMTHSTYAQPLPEPLFANVALGHYYTGETVEGGWYTMPELAAAGLWTTPTDLARFLIALRQAYGGETSPISQQVAQWMLTEMMPTDMGLSIGLGIFLKRWDGAATCEHSGGNVGYKCNAKIYYEGGDYGAVVMTNADYGYQLVQETVNSIGAAYGWQQPPSDSKSAGDVPESDYAGTYQLMTGLKLTIARTEDRLMAQVGEQPPLELHALEAGKYRLYPLQAAITFAREEAGGASGIRFEQNGQTLSGVRVS